MKFFCMAVRGYFQVNLGITNLEGRCTWFTSWTNINWIPIILETSQQICVGLFSGILHGFVLRPKSADLCLALFMTESAASRILRMCILYMRICPFACSQMKGYPIFG